MMKVAILGAGAAAHALAIYLNEQGHDPFIWSPSGKSTAALRQTGILHSEGIFTGDYSVKVADTCADAVQGAEVVIFALPAMGYKTAMEAAAPHMSATQTVIISAHASFAALYLDRLLAARELQLPIVAWSTTLLRSRMTAPTTCKIATLRKQLDVAVLPQSLSARGLQQCIALFGERFRLRDEVATITLSNINPQSHMALTLCNFTRIELGERWDQEEYSTEAVERLWVKIDAERLLLAEKLGLTVRKIDEHIAGTRGVAANSKQTPKTYGPVSLDTRYIVEDVPFGLVTLVRLARLAGCNMPLHEAGISLFNALYGKDFSTENNFLDEILPSNLNDFHKICRDGFPRH